MVTPNHDNMTGGAYGALPDELKERGRFCVWRYELDKRGNAKKVPYNPRTGGRAQSSNPNTFSDFETACKAMERGGYDGIGIGVFGGISGGDIDHCVTAAGELTPLAREIMDELDTYTEISPSGEGLRMLFSTPEGFSYDNTRYYINNQDAGDKAKAANPEAGYTGGEGLEIYVSGMTEKFMTITGRAINERGIEPRADRLQPVLDKFMQRDKPAKSSNTAPATPNNLQDAELIERASKATNGALFEQLWNGNTSAYASSENDGHSEADMALCNLLAFWTGRDAQRMDSLFRQSGLMRDKWDSRRGASTYGADTIQRAIEGCTEVYTPGNSGVEVHGDTSEDKPRTNNELQNPATIAQAIYACEGYEEPTPTGLFQLDTVLNGGLRSGLTVLGAISSAGKTTLVSQIADNIAANGRPVLFVSCEQSARELVSKSLARMMAERGYKAVPAWAMNSPHERELWTEGKKAALADASKEYAEKIAPRLSYLASTEQPTVAKVEAYVGLIKAHYGVAPVLVVDYLQLLAPRDERDTDKRAADYNVSQLRRMAGEMMAPVIAISSLNRASYSGAIEMASFKESGGIEYAADVLLGLQPYNMEARMDGAKGDDACKKKAKNITNEFKRKAVRECEIVVLKNRNGALPPKPLPVTFDCASSVFYDGLESTVDESDGAVWL